MAKHHHQSKAEQIDNKAHGAAPFHFEKAPSRANEMPAAPDQTSIQVRAYHIYKEKGGSDLENWLEAEQIMMNPTNLLATSDRTGSGGVA